MRLIWSFNRARAEMVANEISLEPFVGRSWVKALNIDTAARCLRHDTDVRNDFGRTQLS